jgi:hypothetical protein
VPGILELVGAQLGRDPDASALVAAEIDDDAAAGLVDRGQRVVDLGAAVTAARAEDVTREALAVHAGEQRLRAGHVPAHKREVVDPVQR